MLSRRAAALRDDRGFTLTEVLVAVTILAIIIVPLTAAASSLIRVTDDTTKRLSESHDMQLVAAYFAEDVRGLGTRDWSHAPYPLRQSVQLQVGPGVGPNKCGKVGSPPAVIRLAGDDPQTATGTPQAKVAAYVVRNVGPERQLHRLSCLGGSTTPSADIVLVHNLAPLDPSDPYPRVTCSTLCTAAPAVPTEVTLTLQIRHPTGSGPPVTVVLSGQRRQT